MQRNPALRLLHLALALFFLANSAGEVAWVHGPSHHGGDHHGSGGAMAMEMGGHAGHHAADHSSEAPEDSQLPAGGGQQCTCAFLCGASAGLALATETPSAVLSAAPFDAPSTVLPARTPLLRRAPAHFIAYPNGPPALI